MKKPSSLNKHSLEATGLWQPLGRLGPSGEVEPEVAHMEQNLWEPLMPVPRANAATSAGQSSHQALPYPAAGSPVVAKVSTASIQVCEAQFYR